MRFVVPISQSDRHLLQKRVEVFKKLGGWKNHQLTFAPTPSCVPDAFAAIEELKDTCPHMDSHAVASDYAGGWPAACNKHFHDVVVLLAKIGNASPWFFFELDCNPLRFGWQDALETGYNAGGKPFCGHVRLTSEVTTPPLKGSHMVGAGMYPANFHIIAAAEFKAVPANIPFDVSNRWRVLNSGVTDTKLIAHRHSCRNNKREGGYLVIPDHEPVELAPVAVLHGCKDDSLADLVLSGGLDDLGPIMKVAPAPVKADYTAAPVQKVSPEVFMTTAGYRSVMKGVWAHPTVSDEAIANHLGVQTAVQAERPPMTEMDRAIARLRIEAAVPISEPEPVSEVQHGVQGDPETGVVSQHETLDPEDSPESGADNVTPPIHTSTEDDGHQGERCDASSAIAPADGDPQSGHSLLDDLTLKIARSKPARLGEWAERLQVPKEELKSLINSTPQSGLSIATGGWISLSV
jgi:hypothetical protein